MLLAGLNYANSIALLITFLLAGFGLIAMHLYASQPGRRARCARIASVDAFVGEHGRLLLTLENSADTARIGLECEVAGSPSASPWTCRPRGSARADAGAAAASGAAA